MDSMSFSRNWCWIEPHRRHVTALSRVAENNLCAPNEETEVTDHV